MESEKKLKIEPMFTWGASVASNDLICTTPCILSFSITSPFGIFSWHYNILVTHFLLHVTVGCTVIALHPSEPTDTITGFHTLDHNQVYSLRKM